MASRPIIGPFPVIQSGDMSGNITSLVTQMTNLSIITYSGEWSGTSPVGTLVVQVSNEYSLNEDGSVRNAGSDWADISSSSVSGNSGTYGFNIAQVGFKAIRLQYQFTSGIGSLNSTVNGKVM